MSVLCASLEEVMKEMPRVASRYTDEVVNSDHLHGSWPEEELHHVYTGTEGLTGSEAHIISTHKTPLPFGQPWPRAPNLNIQKVNTISFAQHEKDEMRELTQASEILTFPLGDSESNLKEFSVVFREKLLLSF
jgi:dual specificity MAP kinase phosphatase